MTWDVMQQIIRIILYTGGGFFFGEAVTNGEPFQAAVTGALALGAFIWWAIVERGKPTLPPAA